MWINDTAAGVGLVVFFASAFAITSMLPAVLAHL
jgi:hypothetical protein